MPTIMTHSFVGYLASKAVDPGFSIHRLLLFSLICPSLPDADVIAFGFGIPYDHALGHRGFTHSLLFAAIIGVLVTSLFFRKQKVFSRSWLLFSFYFFVITASHGVFDAMTNGGLGVAFFAPFDNSRYFFPQRPLQVSPIGVRAFLSEWGLQVMISEFVWIWIPAIFLLGIVRIVAIFGSGKK